MHGKHKDSQVNISSLKVDLTYILCSFCFILDFILYLLCLEEFAFSTFDRIHNALALFTRILSHVGKKGVEKMKAFERLVKTSKYI